MADDHQVVRQGLAELLDTQPGIYVVAQASDGQEAVELTRKHHPNVVIMDISMPRMGGVDATRRIHAEMPDVRVVGLSMHNQEDMAEQMLAAGAETLLNKVSPVDQLLDVLRNKP